MLLHLGVVEIPYTNGISEKVRRVAARASKGGNRASTEIEKMTFPAANQQTTGDVAGYLENKYHIMELFFEENRDFIGEHLRRR